jgi:hypothetical protein
MLVLRLRHSTQITGMAIELLKDVLFRENLLLMTAVPPSFNLEIRLKFRMYICIFPVNVAILPVTKLFDIMRLTDYADKRMLQRHAFTGFYGHVMCTLFSEPR